MLHRYPPTFFGDTGDLFFLQDCCCLGDAQFLQVETYPNVAFSRAGEKLQLAMEAPMRLQTCTSHVHMCRTRFGL
jgi:hypothetical protein